ncbi:MAG: hypothetical protein IPP45_19440 [Sphingomonadales bacterium]|nr:hypothetical protein [Sphingomonadales bacterium]
MIAALFATPVLPKRRHRDWLAIAQRAESDIKLDEGRKPIETLTFLGIKKGDAALDFGSGGGYYTEIMARAVGPERDSHSGLASQFAGDAKGKAKWAGILAARPMLTCWNSRSRNCRRLRTAMTLPLFHLELSRCSAGPPPNTR